MVSKIILIFLKVIYDNIYSQIKCAEWHSRVAVITMYMNGSILEINHSNASSASSVLPQVGTERNTIGVIYKINCISVGFLDVVNPITDMPNFLSIQLRSTNRCLLPKD